MAKMLFTSTKVRFDDCFSEKKDSPHKVLTYLQKIIQNWRQTFWLKCQWVNLSVQGNNLREVIFWRRMKFCDNFVMWAKRFRNFNKKIHARLSKVASYVSRLTFWGNFPKKFHFFWTFSENEQKTIKIQCRNFSAAVSKVRLKSLQKHLEDFYWKNCISFITFGLYPQKLIQHWRKIFRKLVRNAVYVSRGLFREKTTFFGKNTCFFWLLLDFQPISIRKIDKKFSPWVSKLYFAHTGEKSEQKFFFGKKNIFPLMLVTLETKNWEFWQKHVYRVVKTVFYVARGTL